MHLAPRARAPALDARRRRGLPAGSRSSLILLQWPVDSLQAGNAGENAMELVQGLTDLDALAAHLEIADGILVDAPALLDHRDSLVQTAVRFVVAEENHAIGEVADIDDRLHRRADQTVLRVDQD